MINLKETVGILIISTMALFLTSYASPNANSTYQVEKPSIHQEDSVAKADSSELKEYEVKEISAKFKAESSKEEDVFSVYSESASTVCPILSYTEEERRMLQWLVQHEAGNMSLDLKITIAYVVVNRVNSDLFPNTISEVLLQKKQFMTERQYHNPAYTPNEETIQVVDDVLNGKYSDLSHEALFYYAPKYTSWSAGRYFENNLTFLFEMEGCRFFK